MVVIDNTGGGVRRAERAPIAAPASPTRGACCDRRTRRVHRTRRRSRARRRSAAAERRVQAGAHAGRARRLSIRRGTQEDDSRSFANKVAIVTGASSGIGRATRARAGRARRGRRRRRPRRARRSKRVVAECAQRGRAGHRGRRRSDVRQADAGRHRRAHGRAIRRHRCRRQRRRHHRHGHDRRDQRRGLGSGDGPERARAVPPDARGVPASRSSAAARSSTSRASTDSGCFPISPPTTPARRRSIS